MALRLILMRHAKSGWDDPLMPDHDRPLAPRGVQAAARIRQWLAQAGHLPDEALVSTAVRTRETWAGVSAALPPCPVAEVPALYHASPEVMLRVLRGARLPRVVVLGHNPGIAELARRLVAVAPAHGRFADYPTAATLVAEFDAPDWAALRPGTGRVVDFVVPRDLD
jgi:phosphohistidine phosphatase